MDRQSEIREKLERVRKLSEKWGASALLVTEQPNFSWLTGGGRGFLGLASTKACGSILVTRDRAYLFSNNIEGKRLMQEEGLGAFCELRELPWQQADALEGQIAEAAGGQVISDSRLGEEMAQLRQSLTEEEFRRYRDLCREAAAVMEGAMREFGFGISEFEAAGKIAEALWGRGIEPISLFVAADDRVGSWRHFIPAGKRAWKQLIVSICGRRHGLVASITRTVAFGAVSGELAEHYEKMMRIQLASWRALRTGHTMREVYQAICRAYAQNGMDREWMNHHQGGLTGYLPREIIINDRTDKLIAPGQAFAFNPSCPFAKVEDTVFVTADGVEVLSVPGDGWPRIELEGYSCPGILAIEK